MKEAITAAKALSPPVEKEKSQSRKKKCEGLGWICVEVQEGAQEALTRCQVCGAPFCGLCVGRKLLETHTAVFHS